MTLLQNKRKYFFSLLFLFLFLFVSCQTVSSLNSVTDDFYFTLSHNLENQNSSKISFNGFDIYINKLDLESPSLQLICGLNTEELFYIDEFAEKTGAIFAINTTHFMKNDDSTVSLMGVTKFNNQMLTEPVERYSALGFYFNSDGKLRASVIEKQTEEAIKDFPAAFGGYFTIIKNSEPVDYKITFRSRTACGLDQTGRYIYLLTVISKNPLGISGMSYKDCAEVLLQLGCTDALEFDGGKSTALVSPEHGYQHMFSVRKVPAALGFYFKNE